MNEVIQREVNILPNIQNKAVDFAKGIGDITSPISVVGGFEAVAGQEYTTFTGYDTIAITKQCRVSINKSPMMLFPERTAFYVGTTGFEIMFDRSLIVVTMNKDI
jgi:hypothetical protein